MGGIADISTLNCSDYKESMLKGILDEYTMDTSHLAIQHKYFQRKISVKFKLQHIFEEMSFFLG